MMINCQASAGQWGLCADQDDHDHYVMMMNMIIMIIMIIMIMIMKIEIMIKFHAPVGQWGLGVVR